MFTTALLDFSDPEDQHSDSELSALSRVLGVGGEANPGDQRFSSLGDVVSEKTLKAVGEMGFSEMMEIQYRCIRPLLEGRYLTVCG